MKRGSAALGRSFGGWWRARSLRERALLAAAALLLALAAVHGSLLRPLLDARAEARARIAEYERSLALLAAAPPPEAAPALEGSATALLTESAAEFGLTILRIEPDGAGAGLVLADAPFADLIEWIGAVERQTGLRLTRAQLDRRPEPGIVGANLGFGAR